MPFPTISPKQSFPALESEVLAYWQANNTFQKSIDSRPEDNPYRFYDGPPFITGMPHYGHLLGSSVKDAVGRYWTMRGRRVDRVWGWDCHGLPIEERVQKKLGLKSNKDIEERGVKEFIDECYKYTSEVSSEWNWYIDKIGRWVDMDNAYKTMDQDYMESVMWVFSELWKKGLIYEGKRVSLYSWKLSTPISNFEVAMDDTYQDVNDPAITVKFKLNTTPGSLGWIINEKGEFLLGWNKKFNAWHLPGGVSESGESHEETLIRELKEELNLEVSKDELLFQLEESHFGIEKLWITKHYLVQVQENKIKNNEPDTCTELRWFSKDELRKITNEILFVDRYPIEVFLGDKVSQSKAPPISILAWTTTPWTIPANMALAVGKDIDYVLIENSGEQYIVAKNRVESIMKGKGDYTIIREFKGSELVGLSYLPPFPEYYHGKRGDKAHKVYDADFATDTDGTGIVHIAPEFGDVDFGLAKKIGIPVTEALDNEGRYTSEIYDYEGTHYLDLENPEKGANKINIERMKENGTLFKNESITHRVPFCPRSGTPLVQKAQASWFIDIQSQKDKLIEANEQINWFPEYLKEGRFKKGIESAPDWCISRTRFWGAPMPVWTGADGEKLVVSSREDIFELNKPYGQLEKREVEGKILYFFKGGEFDGLEFNLHRPYIDSILLTPKNAEKPKKVLGIHGFLRNESIVDFFEKTAENLRDNGIDITCPTFEVGDVVNYENWKKVFEENIDGVDTIFAHSLGCRFSLDMIIKNQISIKRLILIAPPEGKHEILQEFFGHLQEDITQIKKYVDEIVILYSLDDTEGRIEASKQLIIQTNGYVIEVNDYKHFNVSECKIIEGLIQYGYPLTRIPEVLDVWLDSGSMPYAQMHYPFENKKEMEASFPADFIAEYVGQVRAWFYVMHVLGVLLNPNNEPKPTPSFTNVITTGVINGNDGRKMSKSFGNYPDPRDTIEKYGADPIRFYMLNSPLLSGGDMDFKEEGIIETIKSVMLPIWNTYSFFTTYANIDNWEKDTTEVWFARHGESTSNVSGKMSDGSDNPELTEKGREQAKNAGAILKEQGIKFDIILHTDRIRARDTAEVIGTSLGYTGEYMIEDGFAEQTAGEYANKTLTEIATMSGKDPENHAELRKVYKNNSVENIEQFEERILTAYEEILRKYKGKKILIVGHAGTSRPILHQYAGKTLEDAHYTTRILNADPFRLATTKITNPLDRWILSRLQVLTAQIHDAMDAYDVSRACRSIVEYMDELTNWYVRLSRRRFWGSEMTLDKASGYETLYTILTELSKLLAPYMPFMSESIFQGLTQRESVHLEYITRPNPHLIDNALNRDMQICEQIVSLGLALRARKNIRVRQPLQSVTITHELSEYYQAIIRDELNIKEIRYEDPEKLAKKICKPDARKIGPKYGKDVQKVINEAKNGNFIEKGNGVIDVGGFVLEQGEYTIEYIPLEGVGDVEGGYGMVISLDTAITESLKLEGYARDIIRAIQDMRKEADYNVTDRISLHIYGDMHREILDGFADMIQSETLSTLAPLMIDPDVQKDIETESDITLTIQIEK